MKQPLSPPPKSKIKLADYDPRHVEGDWGKESAEVESAKNAKKIGELAYRLYAENQRAILLVLQGLDTAGKDGTIRHVLTDVSPQGCVVTPFKAPTSEELAHDFLWRIHKAVPERGQFGVFNRSHYEDVLVVRVHKLVPKSEWESRFERINELERHLESAGVQIVKCFLHISKDEQRERLEARLADSTKRWKFSKNDLAERALWDDYQRAYEDVLSECNTKYARWQIVPSDRKWYRNLVISRVVRETLEEMNPQFPREEAGLDAVVVE